MAALPSLTAERLREVLDYDPKTGVFRWRINLGGWGRAGAVTGVPRLDGYRPISIDRHSYLAHRLAWLYMTGEWPKVFVDHINGDPSDNRFSNLRQATHSENLRNQKKGAANTSGYKGVYWERQRQKWRARLHIGGRSIHLGFFDQAEEAGTAYLSAAKNIFKEFARAS